MAYFAAYLSNSNEDILNPVSVGITSEGLELL